MTPNAVVLDLSPNGLAIVRNLSRRGIRVLALDRVENVARGRTRHAQCRACPDPAEDPEAFADFLVDLGQMFDTPPVLYMAADDFVEAVSQFRDRLEPYYRFLLPPHATIEALLDKRQTHALAQRWAFPAPATWIVGLDLEALGVPLSELPYPCILKPARSYRFRRALNEKAILVRDAIELRRTYERIRTIGPVMIQEFIPGGDDQIYQVGFLLDRDGSVIARFCGRKLLQFPPRFGSGALTVSEIEPEAVALATRIVQTLGLVGLCNVELKRDAREGAFKLMEVDPRLWLWHDLGRVAGVDLAYGYYLLLNGRRPQLSAGQRQRVKWVHELRAIPSARAALRSGERNWRGLLADFRGIRTTALFRLDDPLPFFRFALAQLGRRGVRPKGGDGG